ncbi:single-stranded-DNA-specific exonuclease RecJ [Nitrosophilus kaiyonis]|uniref:single-stranded-DNA-specific exonuclease RecJ n=1 Tax=Nitrosophilus kaiyonis TaxID=2930200 RepID=UPI0024914FDE|nr:single-stranded-DNA-specific exonuclease RecJ [Nitrosophilus kaiyonis]
MIKLTKKKIYEILLKRFEEGFVKLSSLPSPHSLKDAKKASLRVKKAIENREKIAIVGDYDVDGVVSTSIMKEFFEIIDYPVTIKIPNRFKDGYGISRSIIEKLDCDLIITVDNGISAIDAANYCKEKGIDLIITDHHTPSKNLPDAYAIINPKQDSCNFEYPDICGAQVAWFFIAQLKKELNINIDMKRFLDILAIAIIADVMPLKHINRSLVQAGIKYFQKSQRPSIEFLRKTLKKNEFNAEDFGFVIAPILNSAGRMDDASIALKFLTSKNSLESSVYYGRLLALNSQRKMEEKRVFQEAISQIDDKNFICAVGEDWNEGVVGIVAARLVSKYKKPSFVLTKSEEFYKGSGRSFANVDLFSLLDKNREYLEKFGGHKKAAGLTIKPENLDIFKREFENSIKKLKKEDWIESDEVMGELEFSEVDWELLKILESFAPYGESNPMPKFAAYNVEVIESRMVGENGDHLLMTLRQEDRFFKAIKFRQIENINKNYIDIIYYPIKNIFNDNIYIQLNILKIL